MTLTTWFDYAMFGLFVVPTGLCLWVYVVFLIYWAIKK